MRYFQAGSDSVDSLSFTPNGETLVCVEADRTKRAYIHRAVYWLNPRTGEQQQTLDLPHSHSLNGESTPNCAVDEAFVSPDGQRIVVKRRVGNWDREFLDWWDVEFEAWRPVALDEVCDSVWGVCYSASSDLILAASGTLGSGTGEIQRFDLKSWQELPSISPPLYQTPRQLQLTQDGHRLAARCSQRVFVSPHNRNGTVKAEW